MTSPVVLQTGSTPISPGLSSSLFARLLGAACMIFAQWPILLHATSAPLVRSPEQIVRDFCANCHGPNLTGGAGPNLLDAHWNHGGTDTDIARSIGDGIPSTGMPPFDLILTSREITPLVTYLRAQGRAFARGEIAGPPALPSTPIKSQLHSFRFESVAEGLDTPWGLAFLPGEKILFTERPGRLRLIENGQLNPNPITGLPKVWLRQDGGLLDVIAHPDYASNGWLYLAYSEIGRKQYTSMTVVIRGRVRDGRWEDQQTIFRAPPQFYTRDTSHYGCRFYFDEGTHLFFTIGDRGERDRAQDLRSPFGKIHRVNDDGTIPADNPFVGRAGAVPSIWSYGNRHVQGLARSPVTGKLWASEHGPMGGDELNRIEPGQNYGWPVVTFGKNHDGSIIAKATSRPGLVSPLAHWTPSIAICALEFYTGERFPAWKNTLFATALGGQRLLRIVTDGEQVVSEEVIFKDHGRVRDVTTGPDGYLYVVLNSPGRIVRLVPAD